MASTPLLTPAPRLTAWPRDISLVVKATTFGQALADLLWMDICGAFGFRALRRAVARVPLATVPVSYDALTLVRVAVRDACIFYLKPVHCLQRSAVVARMLRRRGLPAQLVIGYQPMPVHWHAWVELDGNVVWDRLPTTPHYHVIDRI